jgi:hypothetical protein
MILNNINIDDAFKPGNYEIDAIGLVFSNNIFIVQQPLVQDDNKTLLN